MFRSIEGIYKDGKVELLEKPGDQQTARVIVTFLSAGNGIDLPERAIDESQAADLRARLRAFSEDWNRPEMDVYDAI